MAEAPDGISRDAVEATGKNVDEAVSRAIEQLGLRRDQVEISVVSEGRSGILGVGAQPARVLVSPKPSAPIEPPRARTERDEPVAGAERVDPVQPTRPPSVAGLDESFVNQGVGVPRPSLDLDLTTESAVDVLETLLQLLGFDAAVTAREPVTPGDGTGMIASVLDVTGIPDEEMGLLIGRRGETLAALQYMVNLIVNHQTRSHSIFGVDIEGYRRRREIALEELAHRIADRVRQNGQAMTLEPMPPAERRIVHMTLADDPDIETVSIGEGDARKVAITPRR